MALQGINSPEEARESFNQFVGNVRLFLRDFAELNRLVDGVETSDRMIAFFAIDAISDWNSTPPLIGNFGFVDFVNRGWVSLLRLGTVVQTITSVGILQTRNHLPFSDGGLNIAVSDKTPQIQAWVQLFDHRWQTQKQQVKTAMNIEQLLGGGQSGVSSDYSELFYFNI